MISSGMTATTRVAIITGASQGIGAGLVAGFRGAGYAVVGNSRSIGSVDELDYLTVEGDIAEPETARRVVDRALDRFGRIDSLINNAGIFIAKPFTEYTADDYAVITAVNLTGFFHITQAAIQHPLPRTGDIRHRRNPAHRRRAVSGRRLTREVAFTKLGINSRRELRDVLPSRDEHRSIPT